MDVDSATQDKLTLEQKMDEKNYETVLNLSSSDYIFTDSYVTLLLERSPDTLELDLSR